ncbi:hypothetical protein pb186bvf_002643 [Paramecium bursaria]
MISQYIHYGNIMEVNGISSNKRDFQKKSIQQSTQVTKHQLLKWINNQREICHEGLLQKENNKQMTNEMNKLQILCNGQSEYVVKIIECCIYESRLWIFLELCDQQIDEDEISKS